MTLPRRLGEEGRHTIASPAAIESLSSIAHNPVSGMRRKKNMEKLVYILGDIHGEFGHLNEFINKKIRLHSAVRALAEDFRINGRELAVDILQCGDFAYFWPRCNNKGVIKNQVDFLKGGQVNLYWCAGNHEDHDELDRIEKNGWSKPIEVDKGIFYCPFGSTLELTPEITVLFAGGAESTDKEWRLEKMRGGYPRIWWPQEEISEDDLECLAAVPRADWVISHTAPAAFNFYTRRKPHLSISGRFLDEVLRRYRPQKWFFGHFHDHIKDEHNGTEWECLADIGGEHLFWVCLKLPEQN